MKSRVSDRVCLSVCRRSVPAREDEPNQPPFDLMVDRNDYHQREFVDERLFLVSPNLVRIVNVLSSSQSGESPSLFPSDCCDDFGDALYDHGQCYT